ncbi:MAG: HAD family hydrolase [Opitutaceae bacterium]|nr:HAD family hydrolase [Opitutaceae bacterium]
MIQLPTLPKHLLFDWGNTVMKDDPLRKDPMYLWPKVAVVPAADHVIPQLAKTHVLSIATNAFPSKAEEIRKALARVNLDACFTHIFSAGDLGVHKQDPGFWKKVTDTLGVPAAEVCMIGDSLEVDILPASRAGLQTVWFLHRDDDAVTMPHYASIRTLRELLTQYQA